MDADAERLFSVTVDIPDFDGGDGTPETWIHAMSHHAAQLAGAIMSAHRHLADPTDVLTYGDVNPHI